MMAKYLSKAIVAELESQFDDDMRTDYSGRGMYDKTCIGYTGENPFYFAAALALALNESENGDSDDLSARELVDVIDVMPSFAVDSMGRGTIYYWPSVRAEED